MRKHLRNIVEGELEEQLVMDTISRPKRKKKKKKSLDLEQMELEVEMLKDEVSEEEAPEGIAEMEGSENAEMEGSENADPQNQSRKSKTDKRQKKQSKAGKIDKPKKKSKRKVEVSEKKNDDLDKFLDELQNQNEKKANQNEKKGKKGDKEVKPFLEIDLACLNPVNELKRFFGTDFNGQKNRVKGNYRRKTFLSTFKENWPKFFNPGLSVGITKKENQLFYFSFNLNPKYLKTESKFHFCLDTHDPNTMMQLHAKNPYHVATLLQLSEILAMQNERDQATDMVERAVYVVESCFDTTFWEKVSKGHARILYDEKQEVNSEVLRLLHSCGDQGTNKTAAELSKLIYTLDDRDPCHMAFQIDYYLMRSSQFEEVIAFGKKFPHLLQLPNWQLCTALAKYLLYQNLEDKDDAFGIAIEASQTLQESILQYPELFKEAYTKVWSLDMNSKNTLFNHVCPSNFTRNLMEICLDRYCKLFKDFQALDWVNQIIHELPNDSTCTNNYSSIDTRYIGVVSSEVNGKILPNLQGSSDGNSIGNPVLDFIQTMLPFNRQ